jgi:hypothetical protein
MDLKFSPSCERVSKNLCIPSQNFLVNAAQAQFNASLIASDGSLTDTGQTLNSLDIFLTCIFTVELMINAFAHFFTPFFQNSYNLIDVVVIALSLASFGPLNVPASVLRMTRAIRVVRLFGRLKSFKTIIGALTASFLPVFNAFLLLVIVISICQLPAPSLFTFLRELRKLSRLSCLPCF